MRKRVFGLLIVLIAIAALAVTLVAGATCQASSDFSTLVCGSTPNSAIGYGAIDICGECHICGVADGICPEDFYAASTETRGSCRLCPDPDCSTRVYGYVTLTGESGLPLPVVGAEVYAVYPPYNRTRIGQTNEYGFYDSSNALSGRMQIYAVYQDYDSETKIAELNRDDISSGKEVNISMYPGTCESDCTGVGPQFTRCKAECQGVNGCQFASAPASGYDQAAVMDLCDQAVLGAPYYLNNTGTHYTYISCCSDVITERVEYNDPNIEQDSSIKTLNQQVMRGMLDGEAVDVLFVLWTEDQD